MKHCKCGCGKEVKEKNNFIHGHNGKGIKRDVLKGRWSKDYNSCVNCNTITIPYNGNGLCRKCYRKVLYKLKKSNIGAWSKKYSCCTDCYRIDRPHASNGRCGTCYTNNLNRKKGVKKRNFGGWSWYHDACTKCGTTEKQHVKNGLCYDCNQESKRDFSNNNELCPVCNVKVKKLNQHLSMKSKKCEKHENYQHKLLKQYFESDLGLDDVSKELDGMDRHTITRQFIKFFGKEETTKRNQAVKSCLCSSRAKIGFNNKNRFGTAVYYDSLNNGKIRFRSKLEKKYAELLDESGVRWFYEYKSFPYIDSEGKRRTYTPDFYLIDTNEYIEIKGYERDNDQYKINYLKEKGIDIKMVKEVVYNE